MHVRRVILLLLGETTPRRARVRCRGSCCCEQRADWYYWFTLEGEAGLCVGHASVHSDSGSRAWGSGGCARARVVLNSSSSSSTNSQMKRSCLLKHRVLVSWMEVLTFTVLRLFL